MIVTVINRARQRRLWGNGYKRIDQILDRIEISDSCPSCGGPRGPVRSERICEDGEWFDVSRWENPCGHLDLYADVLIEAGVEKCPGQTATGESQ